MDGRQYNFEIDIFHGTVKCDEYERKHIFEVAQSSYSYKQGGHTLMIVGAKNRFEAMIAANKQFQREMKELQEQMINKQKEIDTLNNYIESEVRNYEAKN